MILPVYLYGQPVLRKEAEEVPMDYPDLKQLVANLFETMYNADEMCIRDSSEVDCVNKSLHNKFVF